MNLFGKKETPKEALRSSKRELTTATRGIDREIDLLKNEEKKLVLEVKKAAKTGNKAATRSLARDLVRVRGQITKMHGTSTQLRGISSHATSAHAGLAVAGAMKSAGKVMGSVNEQMNPAEQRRMLQEFQKQSAQMDMAEDIIGDSLDDALDGDGIDDEADDVTNQVLDEIGVETASQLTPAPRKMVAGRAAATSAEDNDTSTADDLAKRLHALRNS